MRGLVYTYIRRPEQRRPTASVNARRPRPPVTTAGLTKTTCKRKWPKQATPRRARLWARCTNQNFSTTTALKQNFCTCVLHHQKLNIDLAHSSYPGTCRTCTDLRRKPSPEHTYHIITGTPLPPIHPIPTPRKGRSVSTVLRGMPEELVTETFTKPP